MNTKSQPKNSTVLILGGGVLCFFAGALITYLSTPQQIIDKTIETKTVTEDKTIDETVSYAWHAPEDYEAIAPDYDDLITLPEPDIIGSMTVESALHARRTVRNFSQEPLSLEDVSQMLWAGIGVTNDDGKRTAPSRGGENPTRLFFVASNVTGLEPGLYEYIEKEHALGTIRIGNFSDEWESITHQSYPADVPAVMLISGDMYKQYYRYSDTSERLVLQESGHIGQNLYLQAETLGMGVVVMGGFDTVAGQEFLGTMPNEPVVYIVPFGYRDE